MVKARNGSGKVKDILVQEDFEEYLEKLGALKNEIFQKIYLRLAFPEPRKDIAHKVWYNLQNGYIELRKLRDSYLTKEQLFQELPHLEYVEE